MSSLTVFDLQSISCKDCAQLATVQHLSDSCSPGLAGQLVLRDSLLHLPGPYVSDRDS